MLNLSAERDSALGTGRGYDRIREMGIHFLWGMGEGAYGRFQTMSGREVHSTFASLLVSYGLFGLLGYLVLFFKGFVNKRSLLRNLSIMSGIFLYQLSHNGIRNTLLWLVIVLLLLEKQDAVSS